VVSVLTVNTLQQVISTPACRTAQSNPFNFGHEVTAVRVPLCTSLWALSKTTGDKNIFVELLLS